MISTLYIGLPIAMMVDLRNYAMVVPVGIVCLIWVNDTMAYITGSFIGRTTFTDISPKKTIEGTVGGIVFTMIIGWVFGSYMQDYLLPIHWMVIAGIVAIAGTLGDLLESQMKRKAGIKDSGNILPGHGGALDRFDSLLAVLPFVYLYFHSFANPHLL
ncbi:MAG: phosphatidate cytidylyltransferase [Taibaiella sp.]|nr:phosphatidate cytidylyltransferase [Taibaiella sp.]